MCNMTRIYVTFSALSSVVFNESPGTIDFHDMLHACATRATRLAPTCHTADDDLRHTGV